MKPLDQYPTRETDGSVWQTDHEGTFGPVDVVSAEFSKHIEQRLSACREFIQDAIDVNHFEEAHVLKAQAVLELTKP